MTEFLCRFGMLHIKVSTGLSIVSLADAFIFQLIDVIRILRLISSSLGVFLKSAKSTKWQQEWL